MPPFLFPLIGSLTTYIPALVQVGQSRLRPVTVARRVLRLTETMLDTALDQVPGWKDIGEARRDKIVGGLTELGLFIAEQVRSSDRA